MRDRLIAAGTVGLFAIPPLLDVGLAGWTRLFRYFAADAYLYFVVGRNFANFGRFTIDHTHSTNGFHPLWQGFLGLLYGISQPFGWGEREVLTAIFLTNIVTIAAAIWLACRAQVLARGRLPASFLFLPLGFYGFAIVGVSTDFGPRGSLWGFINGMESGFSLILYAGLLLEITKANFNRNAKSALVIGGWLALLLLARLDNVFFAIAVCAVLGGHALAHRDAGRFRLAVLTGVPVLVVLIAYMGVNFATTGMLLPVSALAKFESSIAEKLQYISETISLRFHFRDSVLSIDSNVVLRWRLAQIILPALVALVAVVVHRDAWRRKELDPLAFAWISSAVFTLLLAAYNFLFVPLGAQGHWYFPISIFFSSLFLLDWIARSQRLRFLDHPVAVPGYTAVVLFVFAHFYVGSTSPGPPIFEAFVTEQAPAATRHYREQNGEEFPKILSFDDGMVSYATGWPVMTAWGFMLDREAIPYFNEPEKSLMRLAYERGFDRLSSVYYFDARQLDYGSSSAAIADQLHSQYGLPRAGIDTFSYRVDYRSADGRFAVIQMAPVEGTHPPRQPGANPNRGMP